MTDTAMPTGSDTVVMQEHVKGISDTEVRIASGHRKQQNVRQAGEDLSLIHISEPTRPKR